MQSKLAHLFIILSSFILLGRPVFADTCDELIEGVLKDNSFPSAVYRAKNTLDRALKEEPVPNTSSITERRQQSWTGLKGPKAFRRFLGKGVLYLRTPDANTESPLLAMRKHPGVSALQHVEMPFKGVTTTTKAYVAKPIATADSPLPTGEYLIGPEHESIVWHVHGGGTPSAVGANASSKANYYVKRGIPVVAVDQPGHGHGPSFAFTSDEEIHEWNLELMKQLIHPDVKIHFHGHSWGGMKTLRMWQNSNDPNLSRIVAYQSESPGADSTLGIGGPRDKAVREKEINDSMDDWEERAAESDIDFLRNTVRNRKMSPTAQEYTFMTDLFYRWHHLSPEEIAKRKRLNILVGSYDGLVYVGREDVYDNYATKMAGENYYKFTRGRTFKGRDIEQGHQIFDLVDENGDYVAYRIGVDLVEEMSGQNVAVREIEGTNSDVVSLVNKMSNHYANNFVFREFIEQHTETVEVLNITHRVVLKESQKLKSYLAEIAKAKKDHGTLRPKKIDSGMKEFGQRFGIRSDFKKAKKELAIDATSERKEVLADFIQEAEKLEKEIKKTYDDPVYEVEYNHFLGKVEKVLGEGTVDKIIRLENLLESQRSLSGIYKRLSNLDPVKNADEVKRIKSTLERIYEDLKLPEGKRSLEAVSEETRLLKEVPKDEKNKKWGSLFSKAQQDYKKLLKQYRKRLSDHISNKVFDLNRPEGIHSLGDARWETGIDLTDERRIQLTRFTEGYPTELKNIELELEKRLKASLDGVALPEGMESLEQVEKRLVEVERILNKRFIPNESDPDYVAIKEVVEKLEVLDAEYSGRVAGSVTDRFQKTQNEMMSLKKERSEISGELNKLLEKAIPSERLQKAMDEYDDYVEKLIEVNTRYAEKQEHFYINLYETGQLTREAILKRPPELEAMAKEYEHILAVADASEARLKKVKIEEARLGQLRSEDDPDGQKMHDFLETLLGKFKGPEHPLITDEGSIEGSLLSLARTHQQLEKKLYKIQQKMGELERAYQSFYAISNLPPKIEAMGKEYEHILGTTDALETILKKLKIEESRLKRLRSDDDLDGQKIHDFIEKLLGEYKGLDYSPITEGPLLSLAKTQKVLEENLYKVQQRADELEKAFQSYYVNNQRYSARFYQTFEISLKEILDQDLSKIKELAEGEEGRIYLTALKKALSHWESLWNRMNIEENFKDQDLYELTK
jgi:pimeloyl-ACP methyl ester carboxylesterase